MKKVFIVRRDDGVCYIYENRPKRIPGGYTCSSGQVKAFDLTIAYLMGIPFPKRGEMIEWPPPAQTAAPEPEPPAEKLVPITDLAQLNVGDMVRNNTGNDQKVLALAGELVALPVDGQPGTFDTWWTMTELKEWGYQQVVTATRTLSREEARKSIDEGKTVRQVGGATWYRLSTVNTYIAAGVGEKVDYSASKDVFDIPEGRYEIVKGGECG